jgi:hypothetical protein
MSDRFASAQAERNWLERLAAKIPGFAGFQDRELRRDLDKLERERLSAAVLEVKAALREPVRAHTDAGRLAALSGFDRLEKRLDGFSQRVRFADYGATGFFDAVKIDGADLARLYEFDVSFFEGVEALAATARAVPTTEDPTAALAALLEQLTALEARWGQREDVVAGTLR